MNKKCSKCNENKGLSHFGSCNRTKDGLQCQCKECRRQYYREYCRKNPEKNRTRMAAWTKANPEKASAWRRANPEKCRARESAYRRANPEKYRARMSAWQRANPEKCRARESAYRRANPEKYRARAAAKKARRRAQKLNATPKWLSKDHYKQIEHFYLMAQEITRITGIKHSVDHIIPLQNSFVNGLHVPWNLQILTAKENSIKNNKFKIEKIIK